MLHYLNCPGDPRGDDHVTLCSTFHNRGVIISEAAETHSTFPLGFPDIPAGVANALCGEQTATHPALSGNGTRRRFPQFSRGNDARH